MYNRKVIYKKPMDMKKRMVPRDMLRRAADRFKLLGEPVRLEILSLLQAHGELNVQEIVEATGQGQANVSKHLGLMAREGLVRRRQEGLYAFYSIDDPSLSGICLLVCGQLRSEAEADVDERSAAAALN